jgi:hypothetical protein
MRVPQHRRLAWGLICLVAGLLLPPRPLTAADYGGARGVMIPVYGAGQRGAIAVVRLGQVQRGHRKLGFFRVKLCPILVAEDVRVEIRQAEEREEIWAQLCKSLRAVSGGLPLELRNVTVRFPNETVPRVKAKCLRVEVADEHPVLAWDGVAITAAAGQVAVARARLPVGGRAGGLEWRSGGLSLEYDVFADRFTTNSVNAENNQSE